MKEIVREIFNKVYKSRRFKFGGFVGVSSASRRLVIG